MSDASEKQPKASPINGVVPIPQWKPGQSGNPAGYSKGRRWANTISRLLDAKLRKEDKERLEKAFAEGVGDDYRAAIAANQIAIGMQNAEKTSATRAAEWLADREEGKAFQHMEITQNAPRTLEQLQEEQRELEAQLKAIEEADDSGTEESGPDSQAQ